MKWFCKHKDSNEIARYYKGYSSVDMFILRHYLEMYKVFKCNKCGKIFNKNVLSENYIFEEDYKKSCHKVKELGYVSYAEYTLK